MKYLKLFLLTGLAACSGSGEKKISPQNKIPVNQNNSCNYTGTLPISQAHSFKSDAEAEAALQRVMKQTGLPTNFLLIASDVDNAAAVLHENKRYILYNQRFMEDVKRQTKSEFGALSILAHEVGHHLSGHTLLESDARPELELEADRFSGFVLAKMGASLDEACIAMETYGGENISSTHPAKRTRLAAITNGWKEGQMNTAPVQASVVIQAPTESNLYVVDVVGSAKYITLRNRSLSPEEYRLGNSGTPQAAQLNRETILTNLPNGTQVTVLSNVGNTYYVRASTPDGDLLGYIVKSFAQKPTIKPAGRAKP